MCLKIVILLFIAISSVSSQEFLFCLYGNVNETYTCSINIGNPFEKLDFTHINGTHWPGYNDDDVLAVITGYSTSSINIPPIICNKFQNTETLSYRSMGLGIILNEAFAGCTKVKSIDLSNNRITLVDENSFIENVMLEKLHFGSNELVSLPESVFLNVPNLVHLYLEKNNISDLPADIFKSQENVKELNLNNNQLTNLKSEWFDNLKSLNILRLGSNTFEMIPDNTFKGLTSLQQVFLDGNNLEYIHSASFGRLPKLEVMNYMNNQIKAIDARILNVTGVSVMIMLGNVCANGFINDNSTGRDQMRAFLAQCFDKYEELFPSCPDENVNERVCKLEDENRELLFKTETLAREKQELERKLDDQVKVFNAAIMNLQNQINELRVLPTTTTTTTTIAPSTTKEETSTSASFIECETSTSDSSTLTQESILPTSASDSSTNKQM
ncbi:unnamed protein product [Chironomus riparius]|uniref:Uncharacterized protein n=1 Tax=Chironomus riparius TaxID=315576 RepID=A0A9N9S6V7_9DIPT|nr:unnamed protein product [Chironomus riparius]